MSRGMDTSYQGVRRPTVADDARLPAGGEDSLVDAAVRGDATAFGALYDRHLDRVYRFCYYRTGNRQDAEDLTQQTFLHAWGAIGRYRRRGAPFVAWLLTISQRLAIGHHRRARPVASTDDLLDLPAEALDLADLAAASVARDAVRLAIDRLKPDRQQVILMRFIEGFSVAETAAALGKTDNHVRVIQHRALADLRRLLAPAPVAAAPVASLRQAVAAATRRLMAPLRRPR